MKRFGCLLDLLAGVGVLGVIAAFCWMVYGVASPPRPDPLQAPPGVNVHPGYDTANVPCDWCSKMTKNPAPKPAGTVSPSSTFTSFTPFPNTTVTVTVTAPAPSPY